MTTTMLPIATTGTSEQRLTDMCEVLGDCEGWPAATSFPQLDETVAPAHPADWESFSRLMGEPDPWCSGTSFPDLD